MIEGTRMMESLFFKFSVMLQQYLNFLFSFNMQSLFQLISFQSFSTMCVLLRNSTSRNRLKFPPSRKTHRKPSSWVSSPSRFPPSAAAVSHCARKQLVGLKWIPESPKPTKGKKKKHRSRQQMVHLTVFIYFLYTPGGVTLSTGRVTILLHFRKCLLGSMAFTQGKCHIFCPRVPGKALSGADFFF